MANVRNFAKVSVSTVIYFFISMIVLKVAWFLVRFLVRDAFRGGERRIARSAICVNTIFSTSVVVLRVIARRFSRYYFL